MKITIYTLPSCVQCDQTKRLFDKNNISYNVIDVSTDDESLKLIQDLGYSSAPVVVAGDKHWSGFRIEKIKDIVAEMATPKEKLKETSPETVLANSLWAWFETSLPVPPVDLAIKIVQKLKEEGYEIKKRNEGVSSPSSPAV